MPTYDYECENGHQFELFQSMKDEPLTTCTQCGGKAKRRIGTGAGFIFKGGGFYSTDYRSKEYRQKAKAESPATPGGSGGKGSGGEAGAAPGGEGAGGKAAGEAPPASGGKTEGPGGGKG